MFENTDEPGWRKCRRLTFERESRDREKNYSE